MSKILEVIAPYAIIGGALYLYLGNTRADLCKSIGLFCEDKEKEYEAPIEDGEDTEKEAEKIIERDDSAQKCLDSRKPWRQAPKGTPIPGHLSGFGDTCSATSDCSSDGFVTTKSRAHPSGMVVCDKGRCVSKRKDWLGFYFPPSECKGKCESEIEDKANAFNEPYRVKWGLCSV